VLCLTITPDGSILASGSIDNTIKLWSLPDGTLLKTLEAGDRVLNLAVTPDGSILTSGINDKTIKLWSLPDGELLHTLDGQVDPDALHVNGIRDLVITPDGTILVSAADDKKIKLWSLPDGTLLKTLEERHKDANFELAITPDSSILASGDGDGTVKLWALPDGFLLGSLMDLTDMPTDSVAKSHYAASETSNERGVIPCGSPIPEGAICVCDCVAGESCTCVGHTSTGGHYWYPN
jgi:WD40 repeat protein